MQELRYVADVVVVCALNYCNDAKATIHSTKIYNFNQSAAHLGVDADVDVALILELSVIYINSKGFSS